MTDIVVARVAHVLAVVLWILAVVLWIGGVGMVTTVLLPAIRRSYPAEQRFGIFHAMEASFARQARVTTVITGISGVYMTWRLDAWSRTCHQLAGFGRWSDPNTVWCGESRLPHSTVDQLRMMRNWFRRGGFFDS